MDPIGLRDLGQPELGSKPLLGPSTTPLWEGGCGIIDEVERHGAGSCKYGPGTGLDPGGTDGGMSRVGSVGKDSGPGTKGENCLNGNKLQYPTANYGYSLLITDNTRRRGTSNPGCDASEITVVLPTLLSPAPSGRREQALRGYFCLLMADAPYELSPPWLVMYEERKGQAHLRLLAMNEPR